MSSSARKRCATPGRNNYRDTHTRAKRSVEEKDAVEVICRLSPYHGSTPCLIVEGDTMVRCVPPSSLLKRDGSHYQAKNFEFGYVFDDSDHQQAVFERCALDLVEHLITGRNGLLFTYGVTGSGKTYTMTGKPTPDETGLLPRTLDVVFNSIDNQVDRCIFYPNGRNGFAVRSKVDAHLVRKREEQERLQVSSEIEQRFMERRTVPCYNDDYVCSVFVSYVEIYNNYCYDLLDADSILSKRDIRLDINNMVYVEGANEFEVQSSDEALELFCRGEERRRTSDTLLNKESSRSHSVFTIRLVMAPFDKDSYITLYPDSDPNGIVVSQLSLVDLAGSERAKRTQNVGDRLAEAASINKSLMVLRQCIDKLRKNQRSSIHETVPYRDSKLTMLFKNFFEGSGKIRMIICANPRPADFEENLNVLAFAEESQAVQVTRAEDRLEMDSVNRPPVPRRFFSAWNTEIDNISLFSLQPSARLFSEFSVKDYNDTVSISNLKERCIELAHLTSQENQDFGSKVRDGEITLRNVLCTADYAKVELKRLRERIEKDAEQLASYIAENKRMKRELISLRERLSRYEAENGDMIEAEEILRRSVREERSRARKQDQRLKAIQDICDTPTPSVAELRSKFSVGGEASSSAVTPSTKRKLVVTTSTQVGSTARESRRQQQELRTPTSGPGFFNPKYHRRSKSAPRILDHQPTNRVPTGGILRVKMPNNSKHTTRPDAHLLQKSSDYVLTHQEVDQEGNISTSVVKGECIPTAGGGTAVLFNDVEQLSHRSPGRVLRNSRRGPSS